MPDPKANASLSVKVEAIEPVLAVKEQGTLINNMISTDDKKGAGAKITLKAGKASTIKAAGEINVKVDLSAKAKPKIRASKTTFEIKRVKLPGKLIKMKDLISQPFKDPIHDVKEIPRFDIYKK